MWFTFTLKSWEALFRPLHAHKCNLELHNCIVSQLCQNWPYLNSPQFANAIFKSFVEKLRGRESMVGMNEGCFTLIKVGELICESWTYFFKVTSFISSFGINMLCNCTHYGRDYVPSIFFIFTTNALLYANICSNVVIMFHYLSIKVQAW